MTNTEQNEVAPEAVVLPPPRVRMDKSRAYSQVHGERRPGDPISEVHFIQDGVPADAQGYFLFDHPMLRAPGADGDRARKAAERKLKKAVAQQLKNPPKPVARATDDDDEREDVADEDDEGGDDDLEPINLSQWLTGEQEVEWQEITQEIARRYKKRVAKMEDAVAFLVAEGVVQKGQLRKKFQKFVD